MSNNKSVLTKLNLGYALVFDQIFNYFYDGDGDDDVVEQVYDFFQ